MICALGKMGVGEKKISGKKQWWGTMLSESDFTEVFKVLPLPPTVQSLYYTGDFQCKRFLRCTEGPIIVICTFRHFRRTLNRIDMP